MSAILALQGPRKKAAGMLSLHDKLKDNSDEVLVNTYRTRREVPVRRSRDCRVKPRNLCFISSSNEAGKGWDEDERVSCLGITFTLADI